MHVVSSQLDLNASHHAESTITRTAKLERLTNTDAASPATQANSFDAIFQRMMSLRLEDSAPVRIPQAATAPGDPESAAHCCKEKKGELLDTLLSMLLGQQVSAASQIGPTAGGSAMNAIDDGQTSLQAAFAKPRMQITFNEETSESETCNFSASGNVCLADGSQRQFDVGYTLDRSEQSSRSASFTFTDPLVLDTKAPQPGLAERCVQFDLDCDGKQETMRLPSNDSGLIFLDSNHNGKADDGSELFGPTSGDGFAELAKLDSDHNGWIDSADTAFADLKLWQADGKDSDRVRTFGEAGIGALSTTNAQTPFTLRENGATLGQQRSTGIWLGENSGAGTVRQIDLVIGKEASAEPSANSNKNSTSGR